MSLPSFTEISPAAQVALLHTLMYSGFRLPDRIGMNSEVMKNDKKLGEIRGRDLVCKGVRVESKPW